MHVLRTRYGPDRNLIKCLGEGDKKNHEDKISLPLGLFVELKPRDRQHDWFVGTNFSQSAEAAMIQNNTGMTEAYWGRLLCQMYQLVDGVQLSVSQLLDYMMELRNHLLQFCRSGSPKMPSVPFTGHLYAQLKCLASMLITGCSWAHW